MMNIFLSKYYVVISCYNLIFDRNILLPCELNLVVKLHFSPKLNIRIWSSYLATLIKEVNVLSLLNMFQMVLSGNILMVSCECSNS